MTKSDTIKEMEELLNDSGVQLNDPEVISILERSKGNAKKVRMLFKQYRVIKAEAIFTDYAFNDDGERNEEPIGGHPFRIEYEDTDAGLEYVWVFD
jgi:hypothetical protein